MARWQILRLRGLTTKQKEVKFPTAVEQRSRVAITFGPFSLDASATQLLRDGAEVRLRPQALRVLKVLLVHSGQWVRYEQMIAEGWEGTLVSQHTIDVTVGEVKRSLQEYGKWIGNRPKVGYSLDVPRSDELVRRGWHFWNQRTREGLEHAIECFEQAATECPSDFRAFEGLSSSYLTLVTFGMRSPAEMHDRFLEAHRRAEALCGLTPDLRCNFAYGLHVFERKVGEAESGLLRTIEEKPTLASAYVRLALLYGSLGQIDKSVEMVNRAHAADPLWPVVSMMECEVRFWRREFHEATDRRPECHRAAPVSPGGARRLRPGARVRRPAGRSARAVSNRRAAWIPICPGCVRRRARVSRGWAAPPRRCRFFIGSRSCAPPSTSTRFTWRFCAMRSDRWTKHSRNWSAPGTRIPPGSTR